MATGVPPPLGQHYPAVAAPHAVMSTGAIPNSIVSNPTSISHLSTVNGASATGASGAAPGAAWKPASSAVAPLPTRASRTAAIWDLEGNAVESWLRLEGGALFPRRPSPRNPMTAGSSAGGAVVGGDGEFGGGCSR